MAPMIRWGAAGALAVVALMLLGCERQPTETLAQALDDTALEHAVKHADPTYICPMHPQIVRNEPGNCPICGMDLVLQEPAAGDGPMPAVSLDAAAVRHMAVRTAPVQRDTLWKYIETVGYVGYDEDAVVHVHPRASGWVERLYVRAVGEPVKKGQALLELYAPEIVQAQEEALIALRTSRDRLAGKGRDSLVASARERLRLLEVPESVIENLLRGGQVRRTVPILAQRDGIVTELGLREGMYVTPALELFTIADLSSVWVQVEVFEHQLDWVRPGRPAEIRVAALPGRVWEGEVDYVYPTLDPKTRTLRVRLRFANPEGLLKPNMLAEAVIYGGPKRGVLAIPREAVIPAADGARVVRVDPDGSYQPVRVELGMQSRERVEVLSGLNEGERVVVSGQFLIDSESNLQASLRRMSAPGGAGHDH